MVELVQQQVQQLSHQQLQSIEILQMGTQELDAYIRELAQENPMVELDEYTPADESQSDSSTLIGQLRWLEDNDRQNLYYQRMDPDELDPMARVGTSGGLEETLVRFVSRQLFRLGTGQELSARVCYLAACLDRNGYLTAPLDELSSAYGVPAAKMSEALELLRSLEPAGIGADSLGKCLELQLERIGETGPALSIVRNHLELLAKGQFHAISKALSISQDKVRQAAALIRELEPRPGAVFESSDPVCYIRPDITVAEENGVFVAHSRKAEREPFHISPYYLELLGSSHDSEVRSYLQGKLSQAKNVLFSIDQRESTLQGCAQALVERQQDFFRLGAAALRPMTMHDIAAQLGIHESTVSRTVRDKFLQCKQGVFPLRYFFSAAASGAVSSGDTSGAAARAMVQALIEAEDKAHPLSDQQLSDQMALAGCPISRRTVAKYRDELMIPNTSGRRIIKR